MKRLTLFLLAFLGIVGSITMSAQDVPTGLVRVKSNRTQYYLSTSQNGQATTASKNVSKIDQVWILLKDGEGYTLRSANTGQYLQATMTATAAGKATLYIRTSPNATSTKPLINISAKSDCSGDFLNTNTSHNLFKYSFDDGCDWLIETVENFSLDEIRERILGMNPYAGEIEDGAYYRIISTYGLVVTGGSDLTAKEIDADNFYQYWQLKKSGSGWTIMDVVSQKYVQRQTTTSAYFREGNTKVAFNISPVADEWDYRWTIYYPGDNKGFHDASSQGHNVVLWSTNAVASEWHFEKVELSEDDIANARGGQAAFDELVANKSKLQTALDNFFEDKSCLTLKAELQGLSDEEIAAHPSWETLNDDMRAMVLKVKNDTWQQYTSTSGYTASYEKFFRAADYHIYSNNQDMANSSNFTMSNSFGRLSGPTGIVANAGDIIYVYVSTKAKSGSELKLEAVSTDGVAGNHSTGEQTALNAGLNLFRFSEQKMIYILHQIAHQDGAVTRKLENFPDITVHIEGGQLNGYWDATRGMTNEDWKLLQEKLLKSCPFLNLKTERLVFQMDADLVKEAEPNEMEGLMHVWNTICANEDRFMGVEDFEGKYNNIWNVFSGASSYMHSSTYGTWYTESTIPTIMNYYNMTHGGGNLWGPSHEIGHNHQGSINVIGTTESSNNLFSNINTFESGILNSRRYYPSKNFDYMIDGTTWLERNIWMTTGMFFQLYLYFHVQGHDPNFYPNLFRAMRKDPINKGSGNGATDYLKLARKICDVAQADLSEFFEAYGMFIPCDNLHVGDYADYYVTTTQAQITSAKKQMQKYEKKLGNIMFIDDRIIKKSAVADNIFGCVAAADGYKRANEEYPYLMANASAAYIGGDYESFTADAQPVTDDWYRLTNNGKNITFQGTKNYAGHKFYDAEGNFIWATNKRTDALPSVVLNIGMDNITVMTANYDMTDTVCTNTQPGDAIGDIEAGDSVGSQEVFDLTGRRVNEVKRGLYIINGKKVMVK